MEKSKNDRPEQETVYSHAVKAGKRVYYLDVKQTHNGDLYLCITESKRKSVEGDEVPQFEKHKIFLYKEDFAHFTEGLNDVIGYIKSQLGDLQERPVQSSHADSSADESASESDSHERQGFFSRFRS